MIEPQTRWTISEDDGATYTEIATDSGPLEVERYPEKHDMGSIAYRWRLTKPIVFSGDQYKLFWYLRRQEGRRCDSFLVRQEMRCGAGWALVWAGIFSPSSGNYDHDLCLFTVTPKPYDRYTCILEALSAKVNVLEAGVAEMTAYIPANIEWALYRTKHVEEQIAPPNPLFLRQCYQYKLDPPMAVLGDYVLARTHANALPPPGVQEEFYIYWRETRVTICAAGVPVSPSGTGWTLLEDNCALNGTSKWWREPIVAYPFSDSFNYGMCPHGFAQIQIGSQGYPDTIVGTPVDNCQGLGWFDNRYICFQNESATFSRARTLASVLDLMVDATECAALEVVSDFFDINPMGDAEGYAVGINYVTGEENQLDHLLILHNSDITDPLASEPATKFEMTLGDMLRSLFTMFRVRWDVDINGRLRLEHVKYWIGGVGLDLTTMAGVVERLFLQSLNAVIPMRERITLPNSFDDDFLGKDIIYSGPCVAGEEDVEESSAPISTDIGKMYFRPDEVDENGIAMVAADLIEADIYGAINDIGAITGTQWNNAPLSVANLERDFFGWDRYLPSGNVNGVEVSFDRFIPTTKQEGIKIPICCGIGSWNPNELITSRLSALLGVPAVAGEVTSAKFDPATGMLTIALSYSI